MSYYKCLSFRSDHQQGHYSTDGTLMTQVIGSAIIVKECTCSGLSSATFTHKALVNICLTLHGGFWCIFSMSHEVPIHRYTTGARHAGDSNSYGITKGTNLMLLRGLVILKQRF